MKLPYKIKEDEHSKMFASPIYNYFFNKKSGFFARWGKSKDDDPEFSPFGPEILDIEVTTKCTGPGGRVCAFCYKSNTPNGINMSFDKFKRIFDKMPNTLTQIAFGADATCESNPEIWKMMEYSRENGVIPNITVADITVETASKLASLCGAVAVSRYSDKNICYDSIKRLTDAGMTQINIHQMISEETLGQAIETISDYHNDERLSGLNAIVFLSLKTRGRGEKYHPLPQEKFKELVDMAFDANVPMGFDSCGAGKFLKAVEGRDNYSQLEMNSEPCESFGHFSSYIDANGNYFPCSFLENVDPFNGIDVSECNDFLNDIWYSPVINEWRTKMIDRKREKNYNCPIYNV